LRIAFLNPTGQLGGAEHVLLDVLASLKSARPGWCFAVAVGSQGPLVDAVRALHVPVSVVPFPKRLALLGDAAVGSAGILAAGRLGLNLIAAIPTTLRYRGSLREWLHAFHPDIIHTNGFKMHLLGPLSTPNGSSIVWHIHDYLSARPAMKRLLRLQDSRVSAVVANSDSVADDIRALMPAAPVQAIPNAIDLDHFSPHGPVADLDSLALAPPAPPETIRVGLVATYARWKGHDVFLRALAALPRSLPIRAYVIGGDIYATPGSQYTLGELQEMARAHGVASRVHFIPFQPDVAPCLRALDIVVHASSQPEPFGLVIVEAMACAKAVIASGAGGAASLIEDGLSGLAHTPGDAASLASAIRRFAEDPGFRRACAGAARLRAERLFARERLATQLIPLYLRLAADPKAARARAAAANES